MKEFDLKNQIEYEKIFSGILENGDTALLSRLDKKGLDALCAELRRRIMESVSKNGGHLASNLGFVEATVALHRVFSSPRDTIIFDVGHQCYAHKMLTGRAEKFATLRSFGGLSGFTNPSESAHDSFYAGHCGTSLSAALGTAEAKKLNGDDSFTVCIIGDAAFSNGMVFEALNDLSEKKLKLIILLNDNEMSISRNIGGLSDHFSKIRTSEKYFGFKHSFQHFLGRIPLIGAGLADFFRFCKNTVKRMLVSDNIFECMGLNYLGPVDGHDIAKLELVLSEAKREKKPSIVHMITKKGCGYQPAEENPEIYHAVPPFVPEKGVTKDKQGIEKASSFSDAFGRCICTIAEKNKNICAVTAAMCTGTGLADFAVKYPDRFFDVGIAEEHAVAFSGALAVGGMTPVCAIYSTFLQRSYDQIIHDVALQRAPVIFAVDRAGIVPGDGATHQGIFDVAFLSTIPGMSIYSPDSYSELEKILRKLTKERTLSAVRYPKGNERDYDRSRWYATNKLTDIDALMCDFGFFSETENPDTVIVTYGRITASCVSEAERLASCGRRVRIIKLIRLMPVCNEIVSELCRSRAKIYFAEEGIRYGGISERIIAMMKEKNDGNMQKQISVIALDDFFSTQGDAERLFPIHID